MIYDRFIEPVPVETREPSLDEFIKTTSMFSAVELSEFNGCYTVKLNYDTEVEQYSVTHPLFASESITVTDAMIEISPNDHGAMVLVQFNRGDIKSPIIVGKVRKIGKANDALQNEDNGVVDGIHQSKDKIKLQCGKSSITLTRAGKVIIRGAYIISRSDGVNKVRGATIQLN